MIFIGLKYVHVHRIKVCPNCLPQFGTILTGDNEQAENELERREWIDVIQAVIAWLLNNQQLISHDRTAGTPTRPLRPTHSRHNSITSDGTLDFNMGLDFTHSHVAKSSDAGVDHSDDDCDVGVRYKPMHCFALDTYWLRRIKRYPLSFFYKALHVV